MSLSIIVPTLGRPTLPRTIESIVHQMADEDDLIIVTDGHIPHVADQVKHFIDVMDTGQILLLEGPETHDNGGSQRDIGIKYSTGSHLLFMDDDDIYTSDAFDSIRDWDESDTIAFESTVGIFKMKAGSGNGWNDVGGGAGWTGTLWNREQLAFGNVGTPMFIVPRHLAKVTSWAQHHKNSHDFGFIYEVVTKNGLTPVWHDRVIAIIRPNDQEVEAEIPHVQE